MICSMIVDHSIKLLVEWYVEYVASTNLEFERVWIVDKFFAFVSRDILKTKRENGYINFFLFFNIKLFYDVVY